jgi:predicted DNA-binding protein
MANSSVHFPVEIIDRLDRAAKRKGTSRNRIIVAACEKYLDESESENRWPNDFFVPLPDDERKELKAAQQEIAEAIADARTNRKGPPF